MIWHYYSMIKKGLPIPVPAYEKKVVVRKTFYVQLLPTEEGLIATSPISDIYEQASSVDNAVRNYLYSLVDELFWLDARKENLSASMLEQFHRIQAYVNIE